MNLPTPAESYERVKAVQTNLAIEQADIMNHKKNQDIEVGDGRVIIKSPNGSRYEILVDNSGTLSTNSL